jgi:ABC-type Fe3+/spermidine/putrescine transport system ATPase subunit
MSFIELANLTKRFDEVVAVDRLNLVVDDGEYLCILGPTGAGKTTLLRLIAGLLHPDDGTVTIGGRVVNVVPPEDRNTVYMYQQYALFPHMNALENVAFGPTMKGADDASAEETAMALLEIVRLDERWDAFPGQLSGGMQQRLALARGIASGTRILLLDEPLGALDARLRVTLRYQLRSMVKDQGLTAIHVTHDQEEAVTIADRLIVLREGRIEQIGTPREVYTAPRSIFVMNFVGGANFLEGRLHRPPSGLPTVTIRGGERLIVSPTECPAGENVVVGVRQEDTWIDTEVGENRLRGRVDFARFVGGFVLHGVTLDNGDTIVSKALTAYMNEPPKVGDDVTVAFSTEATRVFPYPRRGLLREIEAI